MISKSMVSTGFAGERSELLQQQMQAVGFEGLRVETGWDSGDQQWLIGMGVTEYRIYTALYSRLSFSLPQSKSQAEGEGEAES